ncbi:MAG: DoxX family membrane protein [Myxococcales bacterium]|nr:DoxX family membrane protein [Myxococcales bacterium]MCB9548600.1 DoxX family membrane protein [Myxococcales bacterium]
MRRFFINPGRHDPASSLGLLLLRLVPAVLLIMDHGWPKITAFGVGVADPFGWGTSVSAGLLIAVECAGPALVGLGLFARPAALVTAVGLGLIALRYPWWDASFMPQLHTALTDSLARTPRYLYAACFAGVLFTGPGAFSLDRLIAGKG